MLTIILIPAGRTEYDCQGRIQGTLDVPLSNEGRQQAARAAADLAVRTPPIEALYVGPCHSAQETAGILGPALKLKAKTVESLHNLHQGLWQGLLYNEVKTKQPKVFRQWQEQPETVCPPEGESLLEVRERLKASLAKLVKKHKAGVIGMVVAPPLATVFRSMLRQEQVAGLCQPCSADSPLWESIDVETPVKS
jgi:broad specificity phosphatase PhoE